MNRLVSGEASSAKAPETFFVQGVGSSNKSSRTRPGGGVRWAGSLLGPFFCRRGRPRLCPGPPPPQQDQGAGEQDDASKISTGLKLLCFDFDCVGSDLRHLAVREVVDVA